MTYLHAFAIFVVWTLRALSDIPPNAPQLFIVHDIPALRSSDSKNLALTKYRMKHWVENHLHEYVDVSVLNDFELNLRDKFHDQRYNKTLTDFTQAAVACSLQAERLCEMQLSNIAQAIATLGNQSKLILQKLTWIRTFILWRLGKNSEANASAIKALSYSCTARSPDFLYDMMPEGTRDVFELYVDETERQWQQTEKPRLCEAVDKMQILKQSRTPYDIYLVLHGTPENLQWYLFSPPKLIDALPVTDDISLARVGNSPHAITFPTVSSFLDTWERHKLVAVNGARTGETANHLADTSTTLKSASKIQSNWYESPRPWLILAGLVTSGVFSYWHWTSKPQVRPVGITVTVE